MIGQCHSISIIVNQRVYRSEDSVCVVAVACTLCNCKGVSTSEDINGDYSSAEHCLILWLDYKTKWCLVYHSSVSHSCNRKLVTQWIFVHYTIIYLTMIGTTILQSEMITVTITTIYCYVCFCSLSGNRISDEGCAALSKCLQECRELQTLVWVWSDPYVITWQPQYAVCDTLM